MQSLIDEMHGRMGLRLESFRLSCGHAEVIPAAEMPAELLEMTDLSGEMCDHRYYDVVQRTLSHDFSLNYFVVRDREGKGSGLSGVQPFFVVEQDILAGMKGKVVRVVEWVRSKFPRFMTLRTLMLGNPAGPGTLGTRVGATEAERAAFVDDLAEVIAAYSRRHKVRLAVFKDFPVEHRQTLTRLTDSSVQDRKAAGFVRLPSMPMTGLLLDQYSSFEDYMNKTLSKVTRKSLRRKFKLTADEKIEFSVTNDVADEAEEVYQLYKQVYDRASMKFEKLTPEFFRELSRQMPDRVRFFLWRRQGKLVAASITLVAKKPEARSQKPEEGDASHKMTGGHGDSLSPCHPVILSPPSPSGSWLLASGSSSSALYDLYLGMEYPLALELSLYFLTIRDVVQWCIENKVSTYYSTPLNYDSKLHLRHHLVPLDLYVRHTSSLLNLPFQFAMRFAEPTRHDKVLPQFANFCDVK